MDWNSIVQAEGPMVFETAWRILNHVNDAEDAVQQAFLDAWEQHRRSPVRNWGGYLRSVVTRRAIDLVRKRHDRRGPISQELATASDQPFSEAIARELAARLRWAIGRLPDREATVFSLYFFGEQTTADIAESLGISSDAVSVALHRARAALRKHLNLNDSLPERSAILRADDIGSPS